jgi:hypothetical protein
MAAATPTAGYTHRVVFYHTIRKGALKDVTVRGDFRVCSAADGKHSIEALRRSSLDLVETRLEAL